MLSKLVHDLYNYELYSLTILLFTRNASRLLHTTLSSPPLQPGVVSARLYRLPPVDSDALIPMQMHGWISNSSLREISIVRAARTMRSGMWWRRWQINCVIKKYCMASVACQRANFYPLWGECVKWMCDQWNNQIAIIWFILSLWCSNANFALEHQPINQSVNHGLFIKLCFVGHPQPPEPVFFKSLPWQTVAGTNWSICDDWLQTN